MKTEHATTIFRQVLRAVLLLPLSAPFFIPAQAYSAAASSAVAATFHRFSDDTWITRKDTLSSLGFTTPLVLASNDASREIYLLVPANVPLSDATLNMRAGYLRADGGRTTMVLVLDSYPAAARAMSADQGDASVTLGIDGASRASGFVRLGVTWTTMLAGQAVCSDPRTSGNVLRVAPDSSFSYRYDGQAITDLRTAWGALPPVTVIMVAGKQLTAQSYDTAWRIGVALERAGKHSTITMMPAVGDTIDTGRLTVPPTLHGIPAFAALSGTGAHVLKDQAEVGALLALGQSSANAQVRGDSALLNAIKTGLDALQAQLRSNAPDAMEAFAQWRMRVEPQTAGLDPKELRLASAFGRPVILAGAQAGANFAGLFDNFWRNISDAPALTVRAAHKPRSEESFVLLKNLGGTPGSFDVMSRADWTAAFEIAELADDGRTPPVVSVSLNDVLLRAKHLRADGQRERITAKIPQAFPVAVLASSHIKLSKAKAENNFTGMVRRFAAGANVLVPPDYLAHSDSSLQNVIMLAASTGISPVNARLMVVDQDVAPASDFLSLDVPLKGGKHLIDVKRNTLVLYDSTQKPMLDVSGLNHLGMLEVAKIGTRHGVIYRSVGATPALARPFQLSSGNVAAIGNSGLLTKTSSDGSAAT